MNETEFIIFLEQKLTEIGSAMMNYYNCCDIKGSSCKVGDPNPCCTNTIFGKGLCLFWMFDKCQYENINCKLWICNTAIETTDPKCIEALKLLEQLSLLYGLVRSPLLGHPYSGADKQPKGIYD